MTEGLKILEATSSRVGLICSLTEHPVGAAEYLRHGAPLPDAAFRACQESDAVLLGAMGLPDVRWPDGKEMTPQIDLRERLDLYCGLRPIHLFHPADSPLKRTRGEGMDFLLVRENTEGLFSARLSHRDTDADSVEDILRITRRGSERICHAAFGQARRRRRKVSLIDKANVLPSMVFFRQVFDEIAVRYPDVETERIYVDAAALFLVRRPESFDVMVTENMFGDILSDLAAGLVGGMGMAPSGDVGERAAVFQPSHGSAPDIAGRGVANPIAMILSVAMMLEWLDTEPGRRGSALIRRAVEKVLGNPDHRTPDMGGRWSTPQMGDAIRHEILRS